MADKSFVLDTSALMAFIEQEEGAERVRDILRGESIIIPWLSILEIVYISQRELGEEEALTRYALLKKLDAEIIWEADEALLLNAARIKSTHSLSLADSVIAAIATQHNAILIHKDPEYEQLQNVVEMEKLPYKK
ncbi:MAG: PIN domain-containing protein [Anaerolineales bacterium]|nr:PIN domain-containing protein [Anaerolineales bacterium]MBK8822764.1 PIN domain-containing protein [Anaerolineales bacterium]